MFYKLPHQKIVSCGLASSKILKKKKIRFAIFNLMLPVETTAAIITLGQYA